MVLLVALLSLLAVVNAIVDQNECPHPTMPGNLTGPAFLGFAGEVHLHGWYRFNFSSTSHTVYLNVAEESVLRVSSLSNKFDVSLFLYPDSDHAPSAESPGGVNVEQTLHAVISTGSYRVAFEFEGAASTACETMAVAFAIVPVSKLGPRFLASNAVTCPVSAPASVLPLVSVAPATSSASWKVNYDSEASGTTLYVPSLVPGDSPTKPRSFYSVNFTVPTLASQSVLWRVNAEIGFDFLVSGSLGIVLAPDSPTMPGLPTCGFEASAQACILGSIRVPNRRVIDLLLPGGSYRIWLYDDNSQRFRNRTLSPSCTPFTFKFTASHVNSVEDFLSCAAVSIPRSFDAPGYMTADGRMELFNTFLLDGARKVHNITFTRKAGSENSLFRVKISENAHVDIDLRLLDPSGTVVSLSALARPAEEHIVTELNATGVYTLELSYWGVFSVSSCETFTMTAQMAPVSAASDYCVAVAIDSPLVVPDPSEDLNESENHTFRFSTTPQSPAAYQNSSALAWELTDFYVDAVASTNARLVVRVGFDFLMGGLRMTLTRNANGTAPRGRPIVASQKSLTMLEIAEYLEPGYYTLQIRLAPKPSTSNVAHFPRCVLFSFDMRLVREDTLETNPVSQAECWQWPELPTTLEQPQYLNNPSRQTYISGTFLMPAAGGYTKRSVVLDAGDGDNMLRAYVDPHPDRRIDLDLVLLEDGHSVVSSMLGSGLADQVVYRLKAKSEYTLEVHMFRFNAETVCNSFSIEIAVEPVPEDLWSGPCRTNALPPNSLFPFPDVKDYSNTFSFTQRVNVTETFRLGLTLSAAAFVRVQVQYDFLWGALSLTLRNGEDFAVVMGTGGANSNSIGSIRLEPGNYTFVIAHSSIPFVVGTNDDPLQSSRCTSFTLHAAMADANDDADVVSSTCLLHPLPSSLSSAASLHPLSGNTFEFARHVLMLSDNPSTDAASFTLAVPTLFRVFVPVLQKIDVDVYLFMGNTSIFRATGTGENARYRRLEAGSYSFRTHYFPQMGTGPLPPTQSCSWFPLQLGLIPLAAAANSPARVQCPVAKNPPAIMDVSGAVVDAEFSYPIGGGTPSFSYDMTLTVTTTSVLQFEITAEFGTSAVWARVFRASDGASVSALLPVMGMSSAFFYDQLDPGIWTVRLYRPIGDDPLPAMPAEVACGRYSLRYSVSSNVAPSDCRLKPIPNDVSSLQSEDGALFLSSDSFRAPDLGSPQVVLFNVTKGRVAWRLLMQSTGDTVIDIDFTLFPNASLVGAIRSFSQSGQVEDGILILEPQSVSYAVQIRSFTVRHNVGFHCPSVFLYMAMSPVATVLSNRHCPVAIPPEAAGLPPVSLTFNASSGGLARRRFVISKSFLEPFLSSSWFIGSRSESTHVPSEIGERQTAAVKEFWRFPIDITVREETTIRAVVGSNFLAQNAFLYLGFNVGAVLAVPNGENAEDLQVSVSRVLTPGQHKLVLGGSTMEGLFAKVGERPSDACQSFSLEISSTPTGVATPPRITEIFPSSTAGVNRLFDLYVFVKTNQLIDSPPARSFNANLTTSNLVYLTNAKTPATVIRPSSANLQSSRTGFYAIFSHNSLVAGESYDLHINAAAFLSADVPFVLTADLPTYRVQPCDCSGHGHCDVNKTCVCDTGYSGVECAYCATGFHGVVDTCVPNVECKASTCGAHGNCTSATHGVPECICFAGYESAGEAPCSVCATGYMTDPADPNKCVLAEQDAAATCGLSLLPTSLNGPGFLGFENAVHLAGRYYLDVAARQHVVRFHVDVESVVRVYVEPHKIDVDLSLRRDLGGDKLASSDIAGSYAFGGEEVIFVVLPPGDYGVLFSFVGGWAGTFSPCENAKIELVVRPSAAVKASNNNLQDKCDEATPSAQLFRDFPFNESSVIAKPDAPFLYRPVNTLFAAGAVTENPPASGRRVIGSKLIQTRAQNAATVPLLTAELAYRFDSGDLGLVLEEGNTINGPLHCDKVDSKCIFGTNGYDRNSLRVFLKPSSTYTLWIYEPVKQNPELSKCSLFQFSLEITWRQPTASDELGCPGARMPENLMDEGTGMHWQQAVALTSVTQNTTIQVGSGGKQLRLGFNLNRGTRNVVVASGAQMTLYKVGSSGWRQVASDFVSSSRPQGWILSRLDPGTYVVSLTMSQLLGAGQESSRCRLVDVELAIESATLPVPSASVLGCPANGQATMPVLPMPLLGVGNTSFELPFAGTDGRLITYYAIAPGNAPVFRIPVTVTEDTFLMAVALSAFYTSPAKLALYASGNSVPIATSTVRYNEARLNAMELNAGSFILQLSFQNVLPTMACVPFHFSFHLEPMQAVDSANPMAAPHLSTLKCESNLPEGYDYLPKTLNSWKYLSLDGRMDYHSEKVLVPAEAQMARTTVRQTFVQTAVPSVLRMASETVESQGVYFSLQVKLIFANNNSVVVERSGQWQLVQVLQPNVPYVLNWTIENYSADPFVPEGAAPWCKAIALHITVVPLAWSVMDPLVCDGSGSKFPQSPLVPPNVPSTISPFTIGGLSTYYVQQSSQGSVGHDYDFELDSVSNLLVEIHFDFADADIRAILRSKSTYGYYGSRLSATGSHLLVTGLVAGKYSLRLFESSPFTDSTDVQSMRCRPFTFRLSVERDEGGERSAHGYFPIPDTLNDIGYLNYDGSLHFAHEFDLENVNLADATHFSEYTNVSVTTDSVMRVFVRMANPAEEQEMVPLVLISDVSAPANSMQRAAQGDPQVTVDYNLVVGRQYRIAWGAKQTFTAGLIPSRDVQVFVELTVRPVTVVANAIANNAAYRANAASCVSFALPTIVPDPSNGAFLYASDTLTVTPAQSSGQGVLARSVFTLTDDSVFLAVMESQFALSHLTLELRNLNDTVTVTYASSDRNRRMMHSVLPAGTYELSVVQRWTAPSAPPASLAHCTVVSLHISLRGSWQGQSSHVADCTNYHLLPWNLSNPVPFGKPIDPKTGELVVYGEKFLFPERTKSANSASYSFMQVALPTLPSLHLMLFFEIDEPNLFSGPDGVFSTDFFLLGFDKMSVPFSAKSYGDQGTRTFRMARYQVEEAAAAMVQLSFGSDSAGSGTCPYYTFGSYALDSTMLGNALLCTTGQLGTIHSAPNLTPIVNVNSTYYEHSHGSILSQGAEEQIFRIRINVTTTSILRYVMATNGFGSLVRSRIGRIGTVSFAWPSGVTSLMPSYEDHFTNVRTVGTDFLTPGEYELNLTHVSLTHSAGLTNERGQTLSGVGLCLPWSLDLWIAPWSSASTYVLGVTPAQAWALRPNVDLVVRVAVEDVLFSRNAAPATLTDVLGSFSLRTLPDCKGEELIPDSGSLGAAGAGVSLRWKAGSLALGRSYVLCLREKNLYSATQAPLVMFTNHTYQVVAANHCGANGAFSAEYLCVCNTGYGGSDCSVCGIGYVADSTGKCVRTTRPVCQPCSCGCDAQNRDLGQCDDSTGSLVCTCNPSYKGAQCELCSDESQQPHYPLCIAHPRECNPACVHGLCDMVDGTCHCEHHWSGAACNICAPQFAGDSCDQCAPGYTGSNCVKEGSTWSVTELALAGAAALVVVIGTVIAVLAVRRWRSKSAVNRQAYAMTTLGAPDTSDGDDFFDDSIANNEPAPGLLSDQFNLHLSDEEF